MVTEKRLEETKLESRAERAQCRHIERANESPSWHYFYHIIDNPLTLPVPNLQTPLTPTPSLPPPSRTTPLHSPHLQPLSRTANYPPTSQPTPLMTRTRISPGPQDRHSRDDISNPPPTHLIFQFSQTRRAGLGFGDELSGGGMS